MKSLEHRPTDQNRLVQDKQIPGNLRPTLTRTNKILKISDRFGRPWTPDCDNNFLRGFLGQGKLVDVINGIECKLFRV